jgi:hypothetical protein
MTRAKGSGYSQAAVEGIVREIGRTVAAAVDDAAGGPKRLGFALLVFDYGAGGTMAYASNAQRADMIEAIEELIGHLRAGAPWGPLA